MVEYVMKVFAILSRMKPGFENWAQAIQIEEGVVRNLTRPSMYTVQELVKLPKLEIIKLGGKRTMRQRF